VSVDVHALYLIVHLGDDGSYLAPVKIGITRKLPSRVRTIQTASPRRVALAFAFSLPSKSLAHFFEREFHKLFAGKRLNGEWFDIAPLMALTAMTHSLHEALSKRAPDVASLDRAIENTGITDAQAVVFDFLKHARGG
jgi:hypothetical protein